MNFVIVTGMSGAGKSSVLKMLEDSGYYCVDNLPIPFIPKIAQWVKEENPDMKKVALGIDVRSGAKLAGMEEMLIYLDKEKYSYEILFLDAGTEVLVKRFKETRRTHPLTGVGRVDKGIELEREKLSFLKKKADYIIDTSHLLIRELKGEVDKIFFSDKKYANFLITVLSFGFKYGIPADSDLVFDVRFLSNPYYVPELRKKTGEDEEVYSYVMHSEGACEFLDKLEDMLTFLIPHYITEGKNQLVVSIGCTGGHHRSVTLARAIAERAESLDYGIKLEHRDIEK